MPTKLEVIIAQLSREVKELQEENSRLSCELLEEKCIVSKLKDTVEDLGRVKVQHDVLSDVLCGAIGGTGVLYKNAWGTGIELIVSNVGVGDLPKEILGKKVHWMVKEVSKDE